MPTVDFYVLNTRSKEDSYRLACSLIEKAYQQQNHAYLLTPSLEEAQYLDNLLWTFKDISFIPHHIDAPSDASFPTPIRIGIDKPKHQKADILFNFTPQVPDFFSEFSRIIEIVCEERDTKIYARKKYKIYKEQNCPLTTHKISLAC